MKRAVIRLVAALATLLAAAVFALSFASDRAGDADWLPKPAHGKGQKCVADTDWMRRNHGAALLHHRDEVVHEGIRTKRFDLTGCIGCHAVKGADGKPVTYASPKHFCRTCHDYAAVRVDCFECHASTPAMKGDATNQAALEHAPRVDATVLSQYLKSLRQ